MVTAVQSGSLRPRSHSVKDGADVSVTAILLASQSYQPRPAGARDRWGTIRHVVALADYPQIAAGKVRQLHAVDDEHLLLVASDRISAFDHVLSTPIPDKGRVLTAMSVFWFNLLSDVVPNHLVAWDDPRIPAEVRGRALLVRRLEMLQVECVARGYLTGSGLLDYQRTGAVCGVVLPEGLTEASRLPEPIFTPATKAELGAHDENVSFEAVAEAVGQELAAELRELTLRVYGRAAEHARERGVILADTKFEFGVAGGGALVLGDEVLTPDSSRYWPADGYEPGKVQPSFDKQYVRNWLTSAESGWDRASDTPPPPLPDDVVAATRARYVEAYERITGLDLADWPSPAA
ncbi:phosphoribosylaminoimidazolesuccinocarboxamide synthase [Saccharopolyspora spinosporotrichia]|uniref:Phosphoribosylaminoimidazole-succinocarboxamide synthase n=1 Tax=Saccharopolyspora erythraea TaxID=1836 RepID=A0ABN1DFL4_SACER